MSVLTETMTGPFSTRSEECYVPGFQVGRATGFRPMRGRQDQLDRRDSLSSVTFIRTRDPKVIDLVHKLRIWRPHRIFVHENEVPPPFAVPQSLIDDAVARSQLPKAPPKYRKYADMLASFQPDEWIPPLPQEPPAGTPDPRTTPFTFLYSVQQDFTGLPPTQHSKIVCKTFCNPWLRMHGVPRPPRLNGDVAQQQLQQAWTRLTRFEVAVILSAIRELELKFVHDQVLPDYKYMAEAAIRESGGHHDVDHWPIRQYVRSQAVANLAWPLPPDNAAPASNVAMRGTPFTWDRSFEATFGHLKLGQRHAIGLKTIGAHWYDLHKTPLPLERSRERLEAYMVDAWARMTRHEVAELLHGVGSISEANIFVILPDYRTLVAEIQAARAAARAAAPVVIAADI